MIDFIHHFLIGVLACLDGYMNIAMEQTEEYVDGQLKSKYGDCFIRGNNGMLLLIVARLPLCCSFLTFALYHTVSSGLLVFDICIVPYCIKY